MKYPVLDYYKRQSPVQSAPWEVIWRVPYKIYPFFFRVAKAPEIFLGMAPIFFLIYLMKPSFFQFATLENLRCFCHPEKNRVDFTEYPSNHFSGCRLKGKCWVCNLWKKLFLNKIKIWIFYWKYNCLKQTSRSKKAS